MTNRRADDMSVHKNTQDAFSLCTGKGESCVVERRRKLQFFLCSSKLASMAAILCFSQHCLTWNFRAENCRTVFVMFKGGKEAKKTIYMKCNVENSYKILKQFDKNLSNPIIVHKCGKWQSLLFPQFPYSPLLF